MLCRVIELVLSVIHNAWRDCIIRKNTSFSYPCPPMVPTEVVGRGLGEFEIDALHFHIDVGDLDLVLLADFELGAFGSGEAVEGGF